MVLPGLLDLSRTADITFAGRQPGLDFVRGFVHRVLDLESAGWHRLFMETPNCAGLPVSKTDHVVAFFNDKDGRILKNLKVYFPRTPVHVFHSFPPEGEHIHMAFYIAACLKSTGLPVDPERAFEKASAGLVFEGTHPPTHHDRILFHPGSGDPQKNHSSDFWLKLIEKYCENITYASLKKTVLLGPAERKLLSFYEKRKNFFGFEISFCPHKNSLLNLLTGSVLYLGHDSGITHLAAMSGVCTIALFKETDVRRWSPPGPCVKIVKDSNPCERLIEKILEASSAFITA